MRGTNDDIFVERKGILLMFGCSSTVCNTQYMYITGVCNNVAKARRHAMEEMTLDLIEAEHMSYILISDKYSLFMIQLTKNNPLFVKRMLESYIVVHIQLGHTSKSIHMKFPRS